MTNAILVFVMYSGLAILAFLGSLLVACLIGLWVGLISGVAKKVYEDFSN